MLEVSISLRNLRWTWSITKRQMRGSNTRWQLNASLWLEAMCSGSEAVSVVIGAIVTAVRDELKCEDGKWFPCQILSQNCPVHCLTLKRLHRFNVRIMDIEK